MAIDNSKGQAFMACAASTYDDGDDEGATPSKPLLSPYEPFSREFDHKRIPGGPVGRFVSSVYRTSGGLQVIAELLAQEASDDARRLTADAPSAPVLLETFHRGQLYSLLSASLESLSRHAEHFAEWAEEHCEREE